MPVVDAAGLAHSVRAARIVAVIPARYESSRLPGKPLALIDDKPMIQHVYAQATRARLVDAALVATDDERIAAAVDGFGGLAVLTQPTHATGTDRLAEVARALTGEIVVNVQGDEPMMPPEAIDAAIEPLIRDPHEQVSTLRRRLDDADLENRAVVKVVVDRNGYALYFTRSAVPFVRPGAPRPASWKHLGLYAYRRSFLLAFAALPQTPLEQAEGLEQLRALEHGHRIRTVETAADTIGVDTPEDLARVRQRLGRPAHALADS